MMIQNLRHTLYSAALLALAALPATASQPPAAAPDPLAQRLCDALHTLPETRMAQCCGRAPSSSLAGECARTLSGALEAKAVRLDAADVGRCAEVASQALAGCDWVTPLMPRSPEACRGLVTGEKAVGAPCSSSLECNEGLFCRGGGSAAGVCASPGGVGAPCGTSEDLLASYVRQTDLEVLHPECAGHCMAGGCAAFLPLGGACSSNRQCAREQHCGAGHCREGAFAASGEACTATSCGPGTFCKEGKCAALKAAGEPCTSPFECKAACVMAEGAKAGTCGMKCGNFPLLGSAGADPPKLKGSLKP